MSRAHLDVFIHKVQRRLASQLAEKLRRDTEIYYAEFASSAQDIFDVCNQALDEFEGGEPKIAKRELVAYLVISKLARGDYWAGEAKNKAYLSATDLPNGGFPKHVSKGEVLQAADVLLNAGLLKRKSSGGRKYGLADKAVIQRIIDNKSFSGFFSLVKWIQKGKARVPARELDYR